MLKPKCAPMKTTPVEKPTEVQPNMHYMVMAAFQEDHPSEPSKKPVLQHQG